MSRPQYFWTLDGGKKEYIWQHFSSKAPLCKPVPAAGTGPPSVRKGTSAWKCGPAIQPPACEVRVLWLRWTNSQGLQKSCGGKGTAWPLSKWERGPWPLPGQAFTAFLGTLYQGWSSFTMYRFTVGDYLLQITKERMSANYFKEKNVIDQGEKWLNWFHYILGRFNTDFRKLL